MILAFLSKEGGQVEAICSVSLDRLTVSGGVAGQFDDLGDEVLQNSGYMRSARGFARDR
jgi:hypothetical protein